METATSTSGPWATLFRFGLRILLPAAAFIVLVLAVAKLSDVPVTDLLRDVTAVLDGPWYAGFFSTTGIGLWAAAAAICLLALYAKPAEGARSLLIFGGVMSLILFADDAYLLHETIKNEIGVPSFLTIAIYGVIAIALIYPARHYLRARPDLIVFILGVALFALSVLLDAAGEAGLPTPPGSGVVEDIAKFLGIVTWTAFFAGVGRDVIRERPATAA